jgi:EAL domain-containing protein (putative c-di-GMP-specific phosphodiesterase class I)
MHKAESSIPILNKLKDVGVTLSIDDFGTGYSSLSYLKHFPLDVLKIDRSFIRDVPVSPDSVAIVRAIIAMARSLNFSVIAEGVETVEQLEFLKANGCDVIQGFYFSPPVPASEMTRLLESPHRLSSPDDPREAPPQVSTTG